LLVILGFCLTIILCLIFIPQSEAIGNLIEAPTIGLSLLVFSCILFYFAAQACFNPCESLIYDIYKGGCLGYLITATDWTESYLTNEKVSLITDNLDEQFLFNNIHLCHYLFPMKFLKIIITIPFVLRRLTLAECCVRAGSYGLLFHCIVGVLYAPFLRTLIHRFGIHLIFSFTSLSDLGMASLTSIPYTLVIKYHKHREVVLLFFKIFFVDNQTIQTYEICTILGILDSTYFASQIISLIMMGNIILIFKSTLSYIATRFILAICSIYFINRIILKGVLGGFMALVTRLY
ncbi:unnamed protein product, partial [Adineta steineri]